MSASSNQSGKRMEYGLDAWLAEDDTDDSVCATPLASSISTNMTARNGTNSDTEDKDVEVSKKMCCAIKMLLECIGEDPNREGLLATPSRYAETLISLTKGYKDDFNAIVDNAIYNEVHTGGMVVVKDIEIHSVCEQHLLPFTGKMHIGYIPSGKVIGASSLTRIAEVFARRLQIQERLTSQVANAIMDVLKPHGVAVVMESSHLCMAMRGVEKTGSITITDCMLGCFNNNYYVTGGGGGFGPQIEAKNRAQFWSLVGLHNRG